MFCYQNLPIMVRAKFSILLADPDAQWNHQASTLLEAQGIQAIQARTGREALALIEERQIHAAVLDQQMPMLSGLAVVKMLRDRQSAPPAILLSEDPSPHLLQEALVMQVFSVLRKPVDVNQLLQTLARVLTRHYASQWPGARN